MTANEARQLAAEAREAAVTDLERETMTKVIDSITEAAKIGKEKLEVTVPKEVDNEIRLKLRSLGYKADWGQMTANQTFIKVSFE